MAAMATFPMHSFLRSGHGAVPQNGALYVEAAKQIIESISEGDALVPVGMKHQLNFSLRGSTSEDIRKFLEEAVEAGESQVPTIESGNKYAVSDKFHGMNSEIIMTAMRHGDMYQALSPAARARAEEIFELIFLNPELRNRNPLHPAMIDTCIIANLLNFPKHIFGFPFGCHATNGNESLSLVLYSYRQDCPASRPLVCYVMCADEEEASLEELQLCVERLGMEFLSFTPLASSGADLDLSPLEGMRQRIAVAMTSFDSPSLGRLSDWAAANGLDLHLHVRDRQWRNIFTSNETPVHFNIPTGVRSMSIEEGLLNSGYSLYRDCALRDRHLDLGYAWQTAYMSPNEGGSGASAPLFADFCAVVLGWAALGEIARNKKMCDRSAHRLRHTLVKSGQSAETTAHPYEASLEWAKGCVLPGSYVPREVSEAELVCFQREFIGGKRLDVEAMTTMGGTRSINLAFESVLKRARLSDTGLPVKVITGNPHLAVERAERRFQFELVRLDVDGALCVERLRKAIGDPAVAAVYTQTLSYTDGTADPLGEILQVVEEANQKRAAGQRITLINDSCLAFSVLVHNSGEGGSKSLRLLDLAEGHATPVIVMQDAHKHLGTDKGLSTIVGTPGTLSCLDGHVVVGRQPPQEDLVRALSSMRLVGREGYVQQYKRLGAEVSRAVGVLEAAGMSIVHKRNRIAGSSVIAVEDPSGVMIKKLKKRGHSVATLFNLCPEDTMRCQTGWQLSITLHGLRDVNGGKTALEMFLSDAVECQKEIEGSEKLRLVRSTFHENSLMAYLISGNIGPFFLQFLRGGGSGRAMAQLLVRRFFTAQLDSGTVCSKRPERAIRSALRILSALLFCLIAMAKRRSIQRRIRSLL